MELCQFLVSRSKTALCFSLLIFALEANAGSNPVPSLAQACAKPLAHRLYQELGFNTENSHDIFVEQLNELVEWVTHYGVNVGDQRKHELLQHIIGESNQFVTSGSRIQIALEFMLREHAALICQQAHVKHLKAKKRVVLVGSAEYLEILSQLDDLEAQIEKLQVLLKRYFPQLIHQYLGDQENPSPYQYAVRSEFLGRYEDIAPYLYSTDPIVFEEAKSHIEHKHFQEFKNLVLSGTIDPDASAQDGTSLLHLAAQKEDLDWANLLLSRNADINIQNKKKRTPIYEAIYCGNKDAVSLLLNRGADIEAIDHENLTPLHFAVIHRQKGVVELLLNRGANLDPPDFEQETPLHLAARKGYRPIVKLLVERGANLHAQNLDGQTPLHLASENGREFILDILVNPGPESPEPDLDQTDRLGYTALHAAVAAQRRDVAKVLLDSGASVNVRENTGLTPLAIAVKNGDYTMAELLAQVGQVNFYAVDRAGNSILDIATQTQNKRMIRLIQGYLSPQTASFYEMIKSFISGGFAMEYIWPF